MTAYRARRWVNQLTWDACVRETGLWKDVDADSSLSEEDEP